MNEQTKQIYNYAVKHHYLIMVVAFLYLMVGWMGLRDSSLWGLGFVAVFGLCFLGAIKEPLYLKMELKELEKKLLLLIYTRILCMELNT